MNCPVCNTNELSDDAAHCPQCHSDLEIFRLIVDAGKERQKHKKIISALGLFAAVTAIGWASVGIFPGKAPVTTAEPMELSPEVVVQGESRPAPSESEALTLLTKDYEALKAENAVLAAKLNAAPVKAAAKEIAIKEEDSDNGQTITHTVRNGDTFWIIAKKYYHDGTKYKQIAKDNGMSTKQKLRKGMKLKIQK